MSNINFLGEEAYFVPTLILLIFGIIIFGCSSKTPDKDPKSLISNEFESHPVKVKSLEYQKFTKEITFYSVLSGINEATKGALISDKVEKIYFKPGDKVSEKQIVMKFPVNNPNLQYEQAKINFETIQKTYNRMKELFDKGEISLQSLDNIEAQYLVAKRNFESIKQILFVEAPISGILSNLYVAEGQQTEVGKPLFTISNLKKVRAISFVNEKEAMILKNGMRAKIIWNGLEFLGKIFSVSMKMDEKMKGFRVEVIADNPKFILKSGITVEVEVQVYENSRAIVIPKYLVQKTYDDKEFVYVEENGIARLRLIKVGNTNHGLVEIIDGLKPNEKLIIEGYDSILDGTKVKVINN